MSCCCQSTETIREDASSDWFRLAAAAFVAAQSMVFGLAANLSPPGGMMRIWLHGLLAVSAVAVFALAGGKLLAEARQALQQRRLVIEHFFLLGISAAFIASVYSSISGVGHIYYEVVAVLVAVHTFGRAVMERRQRSVIAAARALGEGFDSCDRINDGNITRVPVTEIAAGDTVIVRAGGAIPVDGVITDGVGLVNEAALTGEPLSPVKRPGDTVLAGSRSLDACLKIRATANGSSRRLDTLLDSVLAAQSRPASIQREADRITSWFLPLVMAVSVGTFAVWTFHSGWMTGVFNALAVLLVACPCSMGLATPVGIWSALSFLSARGVLAKDGNVVEQMAGVDTAVFDKTGTLAEPKLALLDLVTPLGVDRRELLGQVAALEAASDHPVALAFRDNTVAPVAATLLPGAGLQGIVHGRELRVGNRSILPAGCEDRATSLAEELEQADGASHRVYIVRDGHVTGVALLRERLRDSALGTMSRLESMGIRCHVMTGDRAEAVRCHNLPGVRAGLTPTDKERLVVDLKSQGRKVLFAGDGINDAPALCVADIAVAVGDASHLARESAVVELRSGNLDALPSAILRCRRAIATIRGNLLFAAAYNLVGMSLAAAGFLHPVAASLLMLASSFTVTWRALAGADAAASSPTGNDRTPGEEVTHHPEWMTA